MISRFNALRYVLPLLAAVSCVHSVNPTPHSKENPIVQLSSAAELESKAIADKNVWVVAVVSYENADSKIFEKNFMPQLAPRLAGIAKVGVIDVQDLPADVMKTDLEDARKKVPHLILFKRVGRAYTNLPTPMDPDGTLHAASTVPHIKKHLKDNGWKDGNGYYRKLGLPSEEL
ncbi:hypothetical protein CYMTET_39037 [Cymbomonas tetramitiformis]|uniref:Uncharacterized protein n=1 Tax=Cymbomonas tetramitiformis TaxID=36881 RepID=A0AAE0F601_9CHLO|nr:hypothetical protein CYMTET_39037 [Cymbomonas tetramitiformis]